MNEDERYEYLASNCVYLASRQENKFRHSLFACEQFYFEVRWDQAGDCTLDMEVSGNSLQIELYLNGIYLHNS